MRAIKGEVPGIVAANGAQRAIVAERDHHLTDLVTAAHAAGDGEIARIGSERRRGAEILLLVGVALAASLGIAAALWLARGIVSADRAARRAMRALAAGDLSAAVSGQERRDEIGGMARAVGVFREALAAKARSDAESRGGRPHRGRAGPQARGADRGLRGDDVVLDRGTGTGRRHHAGQPPRRCRRRRAHQRPVGRGGGGRRPDLGQCRDGRRRHGRDGDLDPRDRPPGRALGRKSPRAPSVAPGRPTPSSRRSPPGPSASARSWS